MEEEGGEIKALIKVWLKVLISLIYTYFIVSKLPKGKIRFFSLLPIFSQFTLLPLSLSTLTTMSYIGFFFTGLANSKLILYSFDHGPLSHDLSKKSFINFLLIASFPIKFKNPSHIQKPLKFDPLNLWYIKLLAIPIFVAICHIYDHLLHPILVFLIYCCIFFLLIDVMLDLCNKLVGSIMVVDLCQPSNEPYLSTSLRDFWGYRWNLVVTDALRHTIYNPVRVFLSKYMGQRWAPIPTALATFMVSGLVHELLFYYLTRVSPSWEVTWFFVLHGLCVVLEAASKNILGWKLGLHWAISGPLTIGFVMGTAYWWLFPPILRNGVDVTITKEVVTSLMALFELFMGLSK